jgi:hypothetical protein
MKYTLSISDCTKEEVAGILSTLEGGTKVEVASAAPVAAKNNGPTVAELRASCDARALHYTKNMKKADLIHLLENPETGAREVLQPAVIEAPPVIAEAPVVVPAAVATPVQVAPVLDQGALIAQFTDCYNGAVGAGVDEGLLQTAIGAQLKNLGQEGVRLSILPVQTLNQFLGMFSAYTNDLIAKQSAEVAPAQNNSFI